MCDLAGRELLYLLIPIGLYGALILFGLMGSIAMSLARDEFYNDLCPLYVSADELPAGSNCKFVIAMHSLFGILVGLGLLGLFVFAVYKRHLAAPLGFLSTLCVLVVLLVVHGIACFLLLVAASVVNSGKAKTCDWAKGCRWVHGIHRIRAAEAASWLACLCWLLLTALFAFRVYSTWRYGEVVTTGSSSSTTASATVTSTRTTSVVIEKSSDDPGAQY